MGHAVADMECGEMGSHLAVIVFALQKQVLGLVVQIQSQK